MRHKSNLFEIGFTGDPESVKQALSVDFEQVEQMTEKGCTGSK